MYSVRYWMDDVRRDDTMDSAVRSAVWYAFHRAGMEIPFPSRNVNMTEMNEDRARRKDDEEYARRIDALSRVDVFRALDAERIDRLSRRMQMLIFGPGETILRQGDPGDSLYVVRSGTVAVQVGVGARPQGRRDAGRGAVLRRDVADDRRLARGDGGRQVATSTATSSTRRPSRRSFARSPSWPARSATSWPAARSSWAKSQPPTSCRRPPRRISSARRSPPFFGIGGRQAAGLAAAMSGPTSTARMPARRAASRPMSVSS